MKIKNLFADWKFKLLSFVMAIVLWLIIMSVADPMTTVTISNVPITVTNDDIFSEAGKSYTVDGRLYTSVRVTGSNSVVRDLTASDFAATADLSKMYDVTGQVPVALSCSSRDASSITYTPVTSSIRITIEEILLKSFAVRIDTAGMPAEGYLLGAVSSEPGFIAVRAPQSVLERIAEVRVSVNVQGLTENASFTCTPAYYTTIGSQLDFAGAKDSEASADEVRVDVEILTTKTVPVVINVGGQDEVASGYRYTGAEQSLTTVQVSGLRSRLASVTAITIPEEVLSVAGASEDVSVNIPLADYLPEGLSLVEGEEDTLTVTMQVAPLIIRNYEVDHIDLIGANEEEYNYFFHNMPMKVQLRALEEDFKVITSDHISAALDVTGYGPGNYSLQVQIELDSVFELFGSARVSVSITQNEPDAQHSHEPEDE